MKYDIYLSPPHMNGTERELVLDAIDSNWVAPLGPHVNAFEAEIAAVTDRKHAAALASGTAALHLALIGCGIVPGDEIICSSFTFIASTSPILYLNAVPIFVDSDAETWTIDVDLLEELLKERQRQNRIPKALIAVDLYGQCANYERLEPLCDEYGILLIEDAAESLGSTAFGRKAGSFGHCAILSFNGNKIITSSGGGMLVSQDTSLVESARHLSTQARDPVPHYEHSRIGYNYRMSNVVAAVGRGQLKTLDQRIARRREIFQQYRTILGEVSGISFMPEAGYGSGNRWLTCMVVDPDVFGATREDIRVKLEEHRIESRPLWKPMHMQPVFKDAEMVGGSTSESLFQDGLCLPSGTALSNDQIAQICDLILETSHSSAG